MNSSGILIDAFWIILAVAGGLVLVNALIDVWSTPIRRQRRLSFQRLGRLLHRQKANTATIPPR